MKFSRFSRKRKNNSGIIIIAVLWILLILSVLAVSLGRTNHIELSLTKNTIYRMKAKYLAWAGLTYAMNQIRLDSSNAVSNNQDDFYYCGIPMDQNNPADEIFKKRALKEGFFNVQYKGFNSKTGAEEGFYGLEDEERRINLNSLNAQNANILVELIALLGFDNQTAQGIAFAVVDWKDEDSLPSNTTYAAEESEYSRLAIPYHCKNHAFDSVEEVLLVKGMTREIFDRLKDYITVYPRDDSFHINFDTASENVLLAMARSLTGPTTNTSVADADSLAEKMIEYRLGPDNTEFTKDDRPIVLTDLSLNDKERVLSLIMNQWRTTKSNFFRIAVQGVDESSSVDFRIQAVVARDDLKILSWQQD